MEAAGLKNGDASPLHNGGSNPNSDPANDPKQNEKSIQQGEGSRTFTTRELLTEMKADGNGSGSLESEPNKNIDRFVYCALLDNC